MFRGDKGGRISFLVIDGAVVNTRPIVILSAAKELGSGGELKADCGRDLSVEGQILHVAALRSG